MSKKPWICEHESLIFSSPALHLIEKRLLSTDGQPAKSNFYVLQTNDWCNIIPITAEGNVVMVKQYRVGIDEFTLEVPGGVIDSDDTSIEQAAIREMIEETGYMPTLHAQCRALGSYFPNPAIMNNFAHSFVVGPVERKQTQKLDPAERIDIIEVPIHEIPERIITGQINHSIMMNAFFLLSLQNDQVKKSLTDQLKRYTE